MVYAAIDAHDAAHPRCRDLLESIDEPLVLPAPVVVEVDWIGTLRREPMVRDGLLGGIADGSLHVENLSSADYARIRDLCRQYDDLPLGLVDASVIAVAERLGERTVATLDHRHFSVVRPRHIRTLTLVP